MKSRKRGFTLIELLGVIIIISLLVLIITPVVNTVIKDSKEKLYQKAIDNITLAAKNWASDKENKDLLPDDTNNCIIVTLAQLKNGGYVDLDIKDPRTGEKLPDTIAVLVTKEGGKYEYDLRLDGATPTSCYEEKPDPTAPVISASMFDGIRKNYSLVISYTDVYGLKSSNSYQYYLSSSYNSLANGSWQNYSNNVSQTIGTGLNGKYYLFVKRIYNTKDVQSSLGGTLINISGTYYQRFGPYSFDNIKPTWTLYGKTNSNASGMTELERVSNAYKTDTVKLTIRGLDDNFDNGSLAANQIKIYINGSEDTNVSKTVSAVKNVTNGVEYTITLTNFTKSGAIQLYISANTLTDKAGNKNNEVMINTGINANVCKYQIGTTWTYNTPGRTDYTVPCKGTYKIELIGADGGTKGGGNAGGKGAYVYGNISLDTGNILYVNVGGVGTEAGGTNGGGAQYGGGASDVRAGGSGLTNRIIVAGGGGGGSNQDGTLIAGGNAGLQSGSNGNKHPSATYCSQCAGPVDVEGGNPMASCNSVVQDDYSTTCISRIPTGGTQTSGGIHGEGWHVEPYTARWNGYNGQLGQGGDGNPCGGGGGGYYGGGGGATTPYHNTSGGGGSSCISGNPSYNCNIAAYQFTNYGGYAGGNSSIPTISGAANDQAHPNATRSGGNGIVRITIVSYSI